MQHIARQVLMQFAHLLQASLFPRIEDEIGELGPQAKLFTQVLAMVNLEPVLPKVRSAGRPSEDRCALAAAFLAKAVYNCVTTRQMIEQLRVNAQMRRLCGWKAATDLPHESTFSRAFAGFAQSELPQMLHRALIE
ncbi:MAG: transposase, partial [Bryobacteraceae bacterium]